MSAQFLGLFLALTAVASAAAVLLKSGDFLAPARVSHIVMAGSIAMLLANLLVFMAFG